MKPEFEVFKNGVTDMPVTICSHPDMPFDKLWKIAKYVELGYTITKIY